MKTNLQNISTKKERPLGRPAKRVDAVGQSSAPSQRIQFLLRAEPLEHCMIWR